MKRTLLVVILFCCTVSVRGQQPKGVTSGPEKPTPAAAEPIKMPVEYSMRLALLEAEGKRLDTDYAQVITLYKDWAAKRDGIQAQAAVLITRAALAAHMTLGQLDGSTLALDDKGNYQWVPKPKPEAAKATSPPR